MPGPAEVLRARQSIQTAIRFLRGGRDDELHLIEPDLLFESGALHAINWMLDLPGGEYFARHLAGIRSIEGQLIRGADHDEP
jgi:hypothetical protein